MASLARTCPLIVARGRRDIPIKRKNHGNCREEDGAKGRALTRAYRRDLTRDPERSSRRRTRGVSSEESAGRRLMILARGSKKGGYAGESGGEISVQVEKKKRRGRTYRFLPFAHTDAHTACVWIRAYSRTQLRCVGGPVLVRECPPEDGARRVRPGVTYNVNAPWYRSK